MNLDSNLDKGSVFQRFTLEAKILFVLLLVSRAEVIVEFLKQKTLTVPSVNLAFNGQKSTVFVDSYSETRNRPLLGRTVYYPLMTEKPTDQQSANGIVYGFQDQIHLAHLNLNITGELFFVSCLYTK